MLLESADFLSDFIPHHSRQLRRLFLYDRLIISCKAQALLTRVVSPDIGVAILNSVILLSPKFYSLQVTCFQVFPDLLALLDYCQLRNSALRKMNVAVNDSHKRTSISQLLNPLGNNSPEATAQSSESLERTPRPSSAASQNDQNAQNGGESSSIHSPGSSFQLRSASWEQRNGLSKGTDGPDPPRPFHFNPHSEGPHGDARGTSRPRDGPGSTAGHGGAWPARHEVPNMPYGTPVITPMYSAERTGKLSSYDSLTSILIELYFQLSHIR